jgi:hypothetical protein
VHRIFRSRGQNLLARDQGTIHIGGQQSDSRARLPLRSVLFFIGRWALHVPRSGSSPQHSTAQLLVSACQLSWHAILLAMP